MKNAESHIQIQVVQWLRGQYPKALFTISPSGNKLPIGVARRFKLMGYRSGTPDLAIYMPKGGFHGMFVELKTETGVLSPSQKEFLNELRDHKYHAVVAYGFDHAVDMIKKYMESGI